MASCVEQLTAVLKGANFVEVSHAEIEAAHRERAEARVELKARSRISARCASSAAATTGSIRDLAMVRPAQDKIEAVVYDDVVLFVAIKPRNRLPQTKSSVG